MKGSRGAEKNRLYYNLSPVYGSGTIYVPVDTKIFMRPVLSRREAMDLIRRINGSGNTHHFIVTADHGFIYKRDKLSESEKIAGKSMENAFVNRRFVVSAAPLQDDGIGHIVAPCVMLAVIERTMPKQWNIGTWIIMRSAVERSIRSPMHLPSFTTL